MVDFSNNKMFELTLTSSLIMSENNLNTIRYLYMSNVSGLNNLDQLNVNKISKLTVLDASHNDLDWSRFNTSRPLFRNNYLALLELYLSYTSLPNLECLGLSNLKKLYIIDLSHNQIETIEPDQFGFENVGRTLLGTLNLANNRIKTIEIHAFDQLYGFIKLYLSENCFKNGLENVDFNRFIWLDALEIANGNLCEIPQFNRLYTDVFELTSLVLPGNRLERLSSAHFEHLQNLVNLNLENNLIRTIDSSPSKGLFYDLVRLEVVNLARNLIDDFNLDNLNLASCSNLRNLNLSYNNLSTLRSHLFSDLTKLETIDLSYNSLRQIEANAFYSLLELKMLYLVGVNVGVKISENFAFECKLLRFVYVSSVDFVEVNFDGLTSSLRAVEANKVVNGAVYYASINIIVDNYDYYKNERRFASCMLTLRFLRHKIHLNLFSDFDFDVFFSSCYSIDLFNKE